MPTLRNEPEIEAECARVVDMWCTGTRAMHMSKMIQIRDVPDAMHRKLEVRAAMAGLAPSDYERLELERALEKPTREELLGRSAKSTPVTLKPSAAALLRAERDNSR